jgi:hypothetical protein
VSDGRAGKVEGTVAVGAVPQGGLLAIAVLVPKGGDRQIIERLLAAVSLDR